MVRAAARRRRTRSRSGTPAPPLDAIPSSARGTLIIIGGAERKKSDSLILEELRRRVGRGKLVIATFATDEPDQQWQEYRRVFAGLGIRRLVHLDARTRDELLERPRLDVVTGATVFFFVGGDQLKITSRFGGTALCDRIRERYAEGATVAGTSSGAAVMSESMMIASEGDETNTGGGSVRMAPGLGFIPGVIVDSHFAERGRIGRLLGAVAQNPRLIGLGIDEDTAVVFDGHHRFSVLGTGGVYVVDGTKLTYTDIAERNGDVSTVHGLTVHVLSAGDVYDLQTRVPITASPDQKKRQATIEERAHP